MTPECLVWLQLERALQLSADMQKRNVPRNVHTHSALMNVCIKCGQLRLALECWENMQRDAIEPNVVRSSLNDVLESRVMAWDHLSCSSRWLLSSPTVCLSSRVTSR